MRILVATDAWHPQVNGVVRTLTMMAEAAKELGVEISFLTPQSFRTFAMPSYPDLRLALPRPARDRRADRSRRKPDSIHIATEGPIGLSGAALLPQARRCRSRPAFTPAFRNMSRRARRFRNPGSGGSLRWFHGPSQAVMAATPALAARIARARFSQCGAVAARRRHRAVSSARDRSLPAAPVFLSVGRVAVEKNLEAFLDLDLPGTKVVVGDGPARAALERKYPRCGVSRRAARRGTGGDLCGGRRLRVPEQDRHVRPGAARGAGQRPAGRGVSGDRSPRRDRRCAGRRPERGFAHGMPGGAADFAAGLRRVCRRPHLAGLGAGICRPCINDRPVASEAESRRARPISSLEDPHFAA